MCCWSRPVSCLVRPVITSRRTGCSMDPVLQFQPWLEFNRRMIRQGPVAALERLCRLRRSPSGQRPKRGLRPVPPDCLPRYDARIVRLDGHGAVVGRRTRDVPAARSWGRGFWGRWFAGLVYPFCGFLIVWLLFPVTTGRRSGCPGCCWPATGFSTAPGQAGGRCSRSWCGLVHLGRAYPDECPCAAGRRAVASWRAVTAFAAWRDREAAALVGRGIASLACPGCRPDLPLGDYLAKSPVWGDRRARPRAWWVLRGPACQMPSARRFPTPTGANAGAIPTWHGAWACTT